MAIGRPFGLDDALYKKAKLETLFYVRVIACLPIGSRVQADAAIDTSSCTRQAVEQTKEARKGKGNSNLK